ncbi:MAG: hypothetical protein ACI9DC_001267 [Gammaproteobacteria bacterium]|jgi:hypothetical protein
MDHAGTIVASAYALGGGPIEIVEPAKVCEAFAAGVLWALQCIAITQFIQGLGSHRAFEVSVQMTLGQRAQVPGGIR